MTDSLASRLADWIDELGLAAHLGEAGLPGFVRDDAGVPSWTEAGGVEPLSDTRLAELDAALRSQGEDPAHAVPVALVLLARKARLRAELLRTPAWTYDHLAQVRGASVNATRFWVHKQAQGHRLLTVSQGEHLLVPAFQLGEGGDVRPELLPVLEPLLAAGIDAWDAWIWLTQPAGLLGGEVPERLVADPAESAVVTHAATRLAQRVTASPKPRTHPRPPVTRAPGGSACDNHR